MGRFYNGDISGKFWFGIQPSDCADRFGVIGQQPSMLNYYFDEDNLEDVENEIKFIEDILGNKIETIDEFFEKNNTYKDDDLLAIGISKIDLREYTDLKLGKQIRDCIIQNGYCDFDAEF